MEKIVDYFGSAFLAMTALPVLKLFVSSMQSGGAIYNIVVNYLSTICG